MYRVIWITSGFLVIAIAVLWFMIDQRSKEILQIQRFVAAGNSVTPTMINDHTRLDEISSEGMAVVFHYSLMLDISQINISALEEQEQAWFSDVACHTEEIVKKVLEPGFEVIRRYRDLEQRHVLEMRFGEDNCQ